MTAPAEHTELHAASGYRAGRTLPLRVELVRQLKRRRTLIMAGILAALPGVASALPAADGLLIRLDADGTARRLIAELVRLDVPVTSVGPHRRLEDAFLTLIGGSA